MTDAPWARLGHGVEDRSSPYHAWGGDRAAQHAADLKYGISVQAPGTLGSSRRCL
jgi:hypothetical protein